MIRLHIGVWCTTALLAVGPVLQVCRATLLRVPRKASESEEGDLNTSSPSRALQDNVGCSLIEDGDDVIEPCTCPVAPISAEQCLVTRWRNVTRQAPRRRRGKRRAVAKQTDVWSTSGPAWRMRSRLWQWRPKCRLRPANESEELQPPPEEPAPDERLPPVRISPQRQWPNYHCSPAQNLWQCDAHAGPLLSRIWQRFGVELPRRLIGLVDRKAEERLLPRPTGSVLGSSTLASRLFSWKEPNNVTQAPPETPEWNHCAYQGEVCLCSGHVRFGNGSKWANEVLSVPRGIIGCKASYFGAEDIPAESGSADSQQRWCECRGAPRLRAPLIVPGLDAEPAHTAKATQAHARPQRFIHGKPYPNAFRNGLRYDYASVGAGARLVTHSTGLRHASSILKRDDDKYMLTLCETRSWFVISLLEDLFLEHIGLISLEYYVSGFRHLQILGSSKYPTDQWRLLGEIETSPSATHELFDLGSSCRQLEDACWVSFIKVRVLSHHQIEDNSYCALTQFQAFGSTQMTFIAEEASNEVKVDPRVEPTVADVLTWHDEAVQRTLAGQISEAEHQELGVPVSRLPSEAAPPVSRSSSVPPCSSSQAGCGLSQEEPSTIESSGSDSGNAGPLVVRRPRAQRLEDLPQLKTVSLSTMVSSISTFLLTGRFPPEPRLPAPEIAAAEPPPGSNGTEEENATQENITLDTTRNESSATMERAFHSLTEALNATGVVTDPDSLGKLRTLFAGLQGAGTDPIAGLAMGDNAGAVPQAPSAGAPPRPPGKTSASTPALVRIYNDMRDLQDGQAALKEDMKSVTSGIRSALVLILDTLEDHGTRVKTVEVTTDALSQTPSSPAGSDSGSLEEWLAALAEWAGLPGICTTVIEWAGVPGQLHGPLLKAGHALKAVYSVDRLLIIMLFLYIVITSRRQAPAEVTERRAWLASSANREHEGFQPLGTPPASAMTMRPQRSLQGTSGRAQRVGDAQPSSSTTRGNQQASSQAAEPPQLRRRRPSSRQPTVTLNGLPAADGGTSSSENDSPLNLTMTTDFGTATSSPGSEAEDSKRATREAFQQLWSSRLSSQADQARLSAQGLASMHAGVLAHRLPKRHSSMARQHRAHRREHASSGDMFFEACIGDGHVHRPEAGAGRGTQEGG